MGGTMVRHKVLIMSSPVFKMSVLQRFGRDRYVCLIVVALTALSDQHADKAPYRRNTKTSLGHSLGPDRLLSY